MSRPPVPSARLSVHKFHVSLGVPLGSLSKTFSSEIISSLGDPSTGVKIRFFHITSFLLRTLGGPVFDYVNAAVAFSRDSEVLAAAGGLGEPVWRGSIQETHRTYAKKKRSHADGLMRSLDELHLNHPFAGSRMLRDLLRQQGLDTGRLHVGTMCLVNVPSFVPPIWGDKRQPDHADRNQYPIRFVTAKVSG